MPKRGGKFAYKRKMPRSRKLENKKKVFNPFEFNYFLHCHIHTLPPYLARLVNTQWDSFHSIFSSFLFSHSKDTRWNQDKSFTAILINKIVRELGM